MNSDRYSIEVSESTVMIRGTLTIVEAFDFLNFYDRAGYNYVASSDGGATICMIKQTEQESDKLQNVFESFYEEEKAKNAVFEQEIESLNSNINYLKDIINCMHAQQETDRINYIQKSFIESEQRKQSILEAKKYIVETKFWKIFEQIQKHNSYCD